MIAATAEHFLSSDRSDHSDCSDHIETRLYSALACLHVGMLQISLGTGLVIIPPPPPPPRGQWVQSLVHMGEGRRRLSSIFGRHPHIFFNFSRPHTPHGQCNQSQPW